MFEVKTRTVRRRKDIFSKNKKTRNKMQKGN